MLPAPVEECLMPLDIDDELPSIAVDIDALLSEMNRTGVATLRNVIPESFLERMRAYIGEQLERHSGQYFGLDRSDGIEDSPMRPIIRHEGLRATMHALYVRSMGSEPPNDRVVPVLRVLAGSLGVQHAHLYHYDSYVVTALVPIIIPDKPGEPRGHLVMFPNQRRARRPLVANLLEKAVVESAATRPLWRSDWVQRVLRARIVPLAPGNVYLFWGMRSLHANEPCLPTSVRATALLHFGDPHEGSPLKRVSQTLHRRSLRRLEHAAQAR
jgi:hypothetical protein